MGRKIFEEHGFDIAGKVLPFEQFRLFSDRKGGFTPSPRAREAIIAEAAQKLGKTYPVLPATEYMMFRQDGNRSIYEGKYFERRNDLALFAVAEYLEGNGRFTKSIADLLWLILEETTWVVPAHNRVSKGGNGYLTYAYAGEVDYIDLFSAQTGAVLATVYYLCRDKLDDMTPILCERLLYELDRRVLGPYLDFARLSKMWWSGYVRNHGINNWNPWIISSVLTATALTEHDTGRREAVIRTSLPMLDFFTATYLPDGGCNEGPSYFGVAGGALFCACLVLSDMTDGYINIYDDPLLCAMGEYEVRMLAVRDRFFAFADCPGDALPDASLLYEWGLRVKSQAMISFGQALLSQKEKPAFSLAYLPYRQLLYLTEDALPPIPIRLPEKTYLDGIGIAITRESSEPDAGLVLAFKGGHNDESHNHNDVGSFIVFADGKPIFLDTGSVTYTAKVFSSARYTIPPMCSHHHNCATVAGFDEPVGRDAEATDLVYDEATGGLSMELKKAYPAEAGILSYRRAARLDKKEHAVILADTFSLAEAGKIDFHFLCDEEPDTVGNTFTLHGRTITFDASLKFGCEVVDTDTPETSRLTKAWRVPAIYRVTLSSEPIREKTFTLTIH